MSQLVLVVEDDATMQKMALKILRSRGFAAELAPHGKAAVTMAATLKPGLILMDLSLPEMNGWEATRALKADPALATIPVVAITAHAMVGDRETAIAAGCVECLTKPYEIAELVALVERYVGPAQSQQPKVA
jgi:CheY-like chemotaxis protein